MQMVKGSRPLAHRRNAIATFFFEKKAYLGTRHYNVSIKLLGQICAARRQCMRQVNDCDTIAIELVP